jgi:Carboxypeptidase regulatory-like domain/TonB dependent receptor
MPPSFLGTLGPSRGLLFSVLILSFLYPLWVFAQSDGATVSGRITDESDAVIQGAKVVATNASQGQTFATLSNEEGIYVLTGLRPGDYQISIEKDGFRKVQLTGLTLEVQDAVSRNFILQIGSATESVAVASGTDELSVSPSVSTMVNQKFVENMPLNGRSFQSLLALTPGYVIAVPSGAAGGFAPGQFSVNGQRANANYFMVDGVSANFYVGGLGQSAGGAIPAFTVDGTTNGLVSVDAMQEFRVQTSTFSPEYGRMPGAQISIVTRSGGNEFHGTAFDYLRNDVFDARNYFDAPPLPKPPLRQNDFGGTFAGPIRRGRAFYFFSYEGLRLRLPATSTGNFYTAAARENVAPAFQPLLAALPIPNGPVNSDGITAPLTMAYSDPSRFNSYSGRIDYNVSDRVTLFGRYAHVPSIASTHYYSELHYETSNVDTLTLGATITLGPEKVNEIRANWSRSEVAQGANMIPFYGAKPPPESDMYPAGYNTSSYQFILEPRGQDGEIRNGTSADTQRQLEFEDTFSKSKDAHQLKFGADLRQITPSGGVYINSALIFSDYGQLQAGIAGSVNTFAGVPIAARTDNYSLFAQDIWRIGRRLTLTYGLRWEINTPLASITPGSPLYAVNGVFNSQPFGLAPQGTPLWHTHFNDLAPRLGVAYQIDPQTVLRGGAGLFYDLGFGGGASGTISNFPYRFDNGAGSGPVPFDFENPAFAPPVFSLVPTMETAYMTAVDPDLRLPVVDEWNLAIQRALGPSQSVTATYVGSFGQHLLREDVIQNDPTGAPSVFVTRNADWSHYNALQLQFQRHLSRGLQVLASYTFAHSTDTNSTDVCQCTYSDALKNIDVAADYASSDFDVRNSFSTAVSYQLPASPWHSKADAIFRNWAVYGIVRASSAMPFDLFTFGDSPVFGYYFARPDVVPEEPLYLPYAQPGGRILNAAAFTNPAAGQQGDLPRSAFRGFPIAQTDLAFSRRFNLSERLSLYLRAEYFNIFNHPMFAPPPADFNNRIDLPSFGQITQTQNEFLGGLSPLYQVGGPRSGQFTLKLQF